jgi:hypothetical protein
MKNVLFSGLYNGQNNQLVYRYAPRQRDGTGSIFSAFPQTTTPLRVVHPLRSAAHSYW